MERCRSLDHVKQLQAHLAILGHGHTHFYAFKLIRLCTIRLANLRYARCLLDKFFSPNVYMYAAVISSYASVSDHESAVLLYRDMLRGSRSRPNHFIFSSILKSWAELLRGYGAESVHAQVAKMGYGGYQAVRTAILDAYSRYKADVRIARKVFDEMSERNVVLFTAMISAYGRCGQVGNAVLLFEGMPSEIKDIPSWNSVISGCAQNGLFQEAIEYFRRMMTVEEGGANPPNQATFVSVLSALGNSGNLKLGRSIHGHIYRNGISFDSFVANSLVDMYGKCGSFQHSRLVFDGLEAKDAASWNSLINSYAIHGRTREAIACFRDMQQHGGEEAKPDAVTFVALLSACAHREYVSEGCRYFDTMIREFGIEPQIEHYGCLVDLLCRSGRFEEAMGIVKGMRIPPDEVVWGSMLHGCRIHRATDLGKLAVEKLIELDPNNGGYRAMLANLYGEMGSWESVQRVREAMHEENDDKPAGCSWIEVENRVHSFHSVDKFHRRIEEVYAVLSCIVDASSTPEIIMPL
ncbi:hypothetical protein M569_05340 [Genlisea aurea]|uniref:Pentatricopeptide repeat-containing protein n=1 Tax=Genlisea aurea TaxID=192259 RepID=S8CQJ4_9LAMI|nr:hypothetical protein M569_05340 [Genlisea aurea]